MAKNTHSRVTESEKRRRKKAAKRKSLLVKLGITALVVAAVAFGVNKFIASRY